VDDYIDLLFVSPDHSRRGVASALLNTLLTLLPERVFTVEASITAKPFFARHGFTVIKQQEVEARGERFVNYRMRRSNRGTALRSPRHIADQPPRAR
jgi:putative acetyltransferase